MSLACACSLSALLPPAWGYYLDPAENSPALLRENAPARTKQVAYTVQDNLNLFAEKTISPPILLPASDNFVPADMIESNMPVFSLFRNPLTVSQDPFANFLYANLRIKKLLDEYAKIQKRAKVLLGSSYQSGMIDLMTSASVDKQRIQAIKNTLAQQNSLAWEVGKLRQRLATIQGSGSTGAKPVRPGPGPTPNNRNTIASFHELQTMLTNSSPPGLPPVNTQGTYGRPGPSYSSSQTNRPPAPDHSRPTEKISYGGPGDVTLPWILDLPFKLFDFALSHKVLSLAIGLICLFFLNIIFGSRS
ncbi:hypothetical protein [Desulfolithobacter sp.]